MAMPIAFVELDALRHRAWELAVELSQLTLYDGAYLACTEIAGGDARVFWTADDAMLDALGDRRPEYARHLREA